MPQPKNVKPKDLFDSTSFYKAYRPSHILQNAIFLKLLLIEIFSSFSFYLMMVLAFLPIFTHNEPKNYLTLFIYSAAYLMPFLLLSAIAGQFADNFDKARLIRFLKFINSAVMFIAALAILTLFKPFIILAIFFMGCIAALTSPIQSSILPEKFFKSQSPIAPILCTPLHSANAGLFMAGFLALLLAYLVISYGFVYYKIFIIGMLLTAAILAWLMSRYISKKNNQAQKLSNDYNFSNDYNVIRASFVQIRLLWQNKMGLVASLILTWFTIFSLFIVFFIFKNSFAISLYPHSDLVFLLVIFGFFSCGCVFASWCYASRMAFTPVIIALVVLSLALFDLSIVLTQLPLQQKIDNFWQFINQPSIFHIMIDMAIIAFFLPTLYIIAKSALQNCEQNDQTGKRIAAHNMQNSIILLLALVIFTVLHVFTISLAYSFIGFGILSLFFAIVLFIALQSHILCDCAAFLYFIVFRLEYKGIDNLTKAGRNPILLIPYESMIDGLLALVLCHAVKLPMPIFFIDNKLIRHWYFRPFLKYMQIYSLDLNNEKTMNAFKKAKSEAKPIVILLDGRIAMTGDLIKNYDNAAQLIEKSQASIIPVKINGLEQSYFAKQYKIAVIRQFFPKVSAIICEPMRFTQSANAHKSAGVALYTLMSNIIFQTSYKRGTLLEELLLAAKKYGMSKNIIEDMTTGKQNYQQLLIRIRLLAKYITKHVKGEKTVALMLPNNNSMIVTFYAMQSAGIIPAMLNFTLGSASLKNALKAVNAKTIITSKQFIEKAQLQETIKALKSKNIQILYIEKIKKNYSLADQLAAKFSYKKTMVKGLVANNPAAILFTSGSEGTPKGVVLTHSNILANVVQIAARLDFNENDKVFNILPMFHSFGLTVATIMPLTNGVPVCFYPSPLHYSEVPEAIYTTKASIIFSTDTFLNGYARNAQAYDLSTIRYCIAGAEPIKSTTRELMMQNFGIRILEGYGVTEASPVISLNTPNFNKQGTVGKILSGIETYLEKVESIETGGRLFIKGPNIMAGYLTIEQPNKLLPPKNGWHDTGDIVQIDEEGFLTILGRAKRFAKIGGEMISLSAVEKLATKLWPEINLAVVAIGDNRKGERLVLICDDTRPNRAELLQFARKNGVAEINIPTKFIKAALPVLGTGKIDYVNLKKLAEETP